MTLNHIEDCFYEKRNNTALHGYNELYSRWISDFDCFDQCLRADPQKCRSFEHWRTNQPGLCVRANISLTDYPSATGQSTFVDYHEIDCQKNSKVIRPSTIHCSNDQVFLTVKLNGIDPNYVLLGDSNCKPNWSNGTHAHFITHINNCSLILTDDSIVGKLRWKGVYKDINSVKHYERFFACLSNVSRTRSTHRTAATSTLSNSTNVSSMLPNHHQNSNDEQQLTSSYRITLEWTLHNRSYFCPESCFVSLYSFINITLDDVSLISTKFFIDSCDLIALYPYANYVQSRRLIYQDCSIDSTMIHVPINRSSLSVFHFSFYLYHILKEPIPFQIQCKISHYNEKMKSQQVSGCSSSFIDNNHNDRSSINKNDKRGDSPTHFRSSSVYVARQLPSIEYEQEIFHNQNTIISTAAVHYIECSLFAFFVLILYII